MEFCLSEGCTKPAQFRGLCNSHYVRANLYVKKGVTTWDELVNLGMAKAVDKSAGRKNRFMRTLEAKRKEQSP